MAKKVAKKNVFVGREKEIDTIKGIIKNEPKANILISGVTGMGKTELCIQIKRLLSENKLIHCGSYRVESKLEDPVNPFLLALFEVFESITEKQPAKKKAKWFKNVFAKELWKKRKGIGAAVLKDSLGTIVKNLTEKIEVGETSSEVADILKEASSEWSTKSTLETLLAENKPAVISTYLALLRQISEQSPDGHKFVLIFDQIENTSEVFQEFLKSIARNLPDKFYVLFALNHEVKDGVEFLKAHKADLMFFKTKPVELEGLNNLEIKKLIEETSSVYKTPDVVENVRRLTDGRPLMIVQWINSKDFDLSVIDEDKLSLHGYYEENLNAAGSRAKRLARVLALLPFPLKAGLPDYAGIIGIDNSDCDELLGKLESERIFRKYPEGCWFSHGLIKEYIFNNMDEAIKKEAAEQIISFLRKKYKKQLAATQLNPARSIEAELLPFTEDYQASFDRNYELGDYHYDISAYETAREHFQNALQAAERLKDRKSLSSVLNYLGLIYDSWGKYDQAIEYFRKSLKIKEEVGDRKGEGVTLNNIGLIYSAWGKYDQAIEYYKKDLKICQETGNRHGEGVTLNNIGEIYRAWGKYDQAIEYYRNSLEIREEVGDRSGEATTLGNIAGVYLAWGEYDQAIQYYEKDLKMCRKIGNRQGEGVAGGNIATVYRAWRKFDQAIQLCKESLKIFEDIGDRKNEGVILNNIGLVHEGRGKFDRAIEHYERSLEIAKEIGNYSQQGVALNNIAGVYRAWGQHHNALDYYQKSLKISEGVGDRQGEGVTLNNMGSVYEALGEYDQAIECYKKSLKILEEIGAVEAKAARENLKLLQEKMKK